MKPVLHVAVSNPLINYFPDSFERAAESVDEGTSSTHYGLTLLRTLLLSCSQHQALTVDS